MVKKKGTKKTGKGGVNWFARKAYGLTANQAWAEFQQSYLPEGAEGCQRFVNMLADEWEWQTEDGTILYAVDMTSWDRIMKAVKKESFEARIPSWSESAGFNKIRELGTQGTKLEMAPTRFYDQIPEV